MSFDQPGLSYTCCECDQAIPANEPRTRTDFGWAHPLCAPAQALNDLVMPEGREHDAHFYGDSR